MRLLRMQGDGMISHDNGERWYDARLEHMIAGPCPLRASRGKRINTCRHQLPFAQGYVIASFEIIDGLVSRMGDT